MNVSPLISIIITTYNRRSTLLETLDSVLKQDYPHMEVIVIDDGSIQPSLTTQEIQRMGIRFHYGPNRGQPASRNIGISLAQGEYLAFIDDDDLWEPNKLTEQIDLMRREKTFWCACDCDYFGHIPPNTPARYSQVNPPHSGAVFMPLLRNNFIASPTVIAHRRVFETVGLFNEDRAARYGEDWCMWLKIAYHYPLSYVPRVLAHYRLHAQSMLKNADIENIAHSHRLGLEWVFRELGIEDPALMRQALLWDYCRLSAIAAAAGKRYKALFYAWKAILTLPSHFASWMYLVNALFPDVKKAMPRTLRHKIRDFK